MRPARLSLLLLLCGTLGACETRPRICQATDTYWTNCLGSREYIYSRSEQSDALSMIFGAVGGEVFPGIYEGEWNDNLPHGKGTLTAAFTGGFFKGNWKSGVFIDGTGREYLLHIKVYEGDYRNGKPHGRGTSYKQDGSVDHQGSFEKGFPVREGESLVVYTDGIYVGQILAGRPNGVGTFYDGDGTVAYAGAFMDGKRHGQGVAFETDGKFEGVFDKGEITGNFTVTYKNGDTYVGGLKKKTHHGQGTYTWDDGAIYSGEFRDHRPHGTGTWKASTRYSSGHSYVGNWINGKRHGWGTQIRGKDDSIGVLENVQDREGWWCNNEESVGPCRPDGSVASEWKGGQGTDVKTNGHLTVVDSDGRKWVGQFKSGYPHGWINLYSETGTLVRQGWFCNGQWAESPCPD